MGFQQKKSSSKTKPVISSGGERGACSGGLPSGARPGNLAHGEALSRTLPHGKLPREFYHRQHVNPEKWAKSFQGIPELEAWVLPGKKIPGILLTGNRSIWD